MTRKELHDAYVKGCQNAAKAASEAKEAYNEILRVKAKAVEEAKRQSKLDIEAKRAEKLVKGKK